MLDVTAQQITIDPFPGYSEVQKHIHEAISVLMGYIDEQICEMLLRPLVQDTYHSEINQPYGSIRLDEEMPRVRVGVKKTVPANHSHHVIRGKPGQCSAVDPLTIKAR